jgi:citrate synthase
MPVHDLIQQAWAPASRHVGDVIRTALVLCADHELNVSAFTGRCVASAGASPYDVVGAALAALKGFRHGGASASAQALLAEADSPTHARAAFADRLRQGGPVAGFGHPLYPDGDPRATALLHLARASGQAAAWAQIKQAWRTGVSVLHQEPNLDFGLAAITRAPRAVRARTDDRLDRARDGGVRVGCAHSSARALRRPPPEPGT